MGSASGGTGRGGWGHQQGAVHMVAARLGCKRTIVGAGIANSCPGCIFRFNSHLVGGCSFLEGCLGTFGYIIQ